MASADAHAAGDDEPADDDEVDDVALEADDADATDDAADDAADDEEPEPGDPPPCLHQRLTPWTEVLTTLYPQGLVIQVNRFFRQRVAPVSYERLVLEPTTIVGLRTGLLWAAALLCGAGLAAACAPALDGGSGRVAALVPVWLAPGALVLGVLAVLAAVTHPRRVTIFLDREAGMHPSFVRDGADEPHVEEFIQLVRHAIIEFRCRPPVTEDAATPHAPRLAATLDALFAMHAEELLTEPELARFRELALRR